MFHFLSYFIYFSCHLILIVLVTVYYHHIAMLYFSYHVIYQIHLIFIYVSSYTLLIVLVTVCYHHIAVLCFSHHVIYQIHLICIYVSSYTLLIVLVTVYYHHIAVLCFSYHVIYHIHLICVYLSFAFMFHACIKLRSGYGKELYVNKGTIIVQNSDLYLYDPNGATIMIQTGSMSSTQTRPRYL